MQWVISINIRTNILHICVITLLSAKYWFKRFPQSTIKKDLPKQVFKTEKKQSFCNIYIFNENDNENENDIFLI